MKTVYLAVELPDDADGAWGLLTTDDSPVVAELESHLCRIFRRQDIILQPMRNGVILKVDQAQRALGALEGLESLPEGYMPPFPQDYEAMEAIRACLEVIERAGG